MKKFFALTSRVGLEFPFGDKYAFAHPLSINILLGKNRNYLDVGPGVTLVTNFDKKGREEWKQRRAEGIPPPIPYPEPFRYVYAGNFGYRHFSKSKRVLYRINYTLLVFNNILPDKYGNQYYYWHWGGGSIGYTF